MSWVCMPAVFAALAQQPVPPQPPPGLTESVTRVENAGNGVGNTIVVENSGTGPAETVITNTRNGVGNRLIIRNGGQTTVLGSPPVIPPVMPGVMPPVPDWRQFVPLDRPQLHWTVERWNADFGCKMYWSPADFTWYWYDADRSAYRPWYVHPVNPW